MNAYKKFFVCVMVVTMLSGVVGETKVFGSESNDLEITQSLMESTSEVHLIDFVTKSFGIKKNGVSHYAVSVIGDGELAKKTEVTVVFQHYNKKTKKWEKGLTFYTPREGSYAATAGDIKLSERGKFRLKVTAKVTPYKGKAQSITSYSDSASW